MSEFNALLGICFDLDSVITINQYPVVWQLSDERIYVEGVHTQNYRNVSSAKMRRREGAKALSILSNPKWGNKMSDQSIRVTKKQIIDAMDEICRESLNTELYYAWERIVTNLESERKEVVNYPQEIFPGIFDALNKITLYGA